MPPSSASQLALNDGPPTVIYVMGAGRSGSTILGVALGNCANVFYAGELEAWLRQSGVPNFGGLERTHFWDVVRAHVRGDDLFGDEAWRYLEYSLAPVRLRRCLSRRQLRRLYRRTSGDLYRAISSVADATHIVDTSHYPLRAHELKQITGLNIYLIYLVRNPANVVASFARRDITNVSKPLLATNAYLALTHLLSIFVFLSHPKDQRLVLRYEDFVSSPARALRQILDSVGASGALPDLTALRTGIPFQGNRLLESPTVAFRANTAPIAHPPVSSRVTKLLQLPWAVALSHLKPKISTASVAERSKATG
jgi:Sulfotransferase family